MAEKRGGSDPGLGGRRTVGVAGVGLALRLDQQNLHLGLGPGTMNHAPWHDEEFPGPDRARGLDEAAIRSGIAAFVRAGRRATAAQTSAA